MHRISESLEACMTWTISSQRIQRVGTLSHSQMLLVPDVSFPFDRLYFSAQLKDQNFLVEIIMRWLTVFSSTLLENTFLCMRHFNWPTLWSHSMNDGNYHTTILVSDKPEGRKEQQMNTQTVLVYVWLDACVWVYVRKSKRDSNAWLSFLFFYFATLFRTM